MKRIGFVAAVAAVAVALVPAAPASAAGKPPRLERFVARYNPSSTTTFYIAVAGDPDGGKLTYRWSLKAECGFLTDPEATGPSQGFQRGPAARRPGGCTSEQDRKATVTLRIVDIEGCAIVYSQGARDETEHIAPAVRTEPCPPVSKPAADPAATGSFPVVPILAVAMIALAVFTAFRFRGRARESVDEAPPWDAPVADDSKNDEAARRSLRRRISPDSWSPADVPEPALEPFRRFGSEVPPFMDEDDEAPPVELPVEADLEHDLEPSFERTPPIGVGEAGDNDDALERIVRAAAGDEPCREGAVRQKDSDFVAHEMLLAGTVRARAMRSGNTVDIPPDDPAEIVRLAAGMSDDAPLEVEVAIPLRLVTVVSSRREVCRDGVWVLDVASTTHDGAERVERLRAIVTSSDELERFAQDILAKRLRSLTGARTRLESALAALRGRI